MRKYQFLGFGFGAIQAGLFLYEGNAALASQHLSLQRSTAHGSRRFGETTGIST